MELPTIPQSTLDALGQLARLIHEAHLVSEAHAKATHERFNVFTTLLDEADEVRLHTRFLHGLLKPEGTHDCGTLFLDLFFETLNDNPGLDHDGNPSSLQLPPDKTEWSVAKEQPRPPHGQIDLLLERSGFGIAIENKINAGEQPRQLTGYAEYLTQRHGPAWRLIYLTKDGKRSETGDNKQYIRISYRTHILTWLEKCLRETYHIVPINQALQQYRKVVRSLTGQTLDPAAMKPITDFIRQHPEIIRYRQQITDAITTVRTNFLDQLAEEIIADLQQSGYNARWETEHKFSSDRYSDLILIPPANHELHQAPFAICIEKDPGLNVLAFGIVAIPPFTTDQQTVFASMNRSTSAYQKHPQFPKWPIGWHNLIKDLSDGGLSSLIQNPEQSIGELCLEIRRQIALLGNAYQTARKMP